MREQGREQALDAAFRAVAEEDAGIGASPAVEARLLAEVRSIAARRRRIRVAALGIAAALLLALAVPAWRMTGSDTISVGVSRPPVAAPIAREVTTEFLPLLYSSVPASHVQMVRLAVPRAALASFGLSPLETIDRASADTVLADVLVGDDGLARAVRFVRPAADLEQMP
jgi:hypothetical protein